MPPPVPPLVQLRCQLYLVSTLLNNANAALCTRAPWQSRLQDTCDSAAFYANPHRSTSQADGGMTSSPRCDVSARRRRW